MVILFVCAHTMAGLSKKSEVNPPLCTTQSKMPAIRPLRLFQSSLLPFCMSTVQMGKLAGDAGEFASAIRYHILLACNGHDVCNMPLCQFGPKNTKLQAQQKMQGHPLDLLHGRPTICWQPATRLLKKISATGAGD